MKATTKQPLAPDVDRREAIVHAAWRVAAREGLAAVTIRSIAKEIGYTTGIVMHHFPTKDVIIEEMIERLYRGLRDIYLAEMNGAPDAHRLERLLASALPLQPRLAFGWKLSVVLQGEVLRSVKIAGVHRRYYRQFETDIRAELARLQENGLLSPGTDLDMAATRLMVLVEGIGANFVLRPKAMPPALQRRLLQEELSRVTAAREPAAGTNRLK